jgi:hypothetical protein
LEENEDELKRLSGVFKGLYDFIPLQRANKALYSFISSLSVSSFQAGCNPEKTGGNERSPNRRNVSDFSLFPQEKNPENGRFWSNSGFLYLGNFLDLMLC